MTKIVNNKQVIETVRDRVLSMLNRRQTAWEGTMSDLLDAITSSGKTPVVFPASAASLRRVVNQVLPAIRRAGYRVAFKRTTDHERTRLVNFTRVTKR